MKLLKSLKRRYKELRIFFLKLNGVKIDGKIKLYGRQTFVGDLENLSIGNGTSFNEGVHINCRDKVKIGNNVSISTYVQMHTGKLIYDSYPRKHESAPIVIEDNVWIASGVVISAGVTLGENSIIAANSVVLKDVESNSLYGGAPAKKIKSLRDL